MAISPYEAEVRKAKAEKLKQEKPPQPKIPEEPKQPPAPPPKKDPILVDAERRLEAIRREAQQGKATVTQENQARSEYLQECLNCHHQYSKRADKCPKCGNVVHMECNICKSKIPKNSTSCPECGDPEPFVTVKVKAEEVARPKEVRRDNTKSDASAKAGNQADTHQRTAALSPLQVLFSFRGRITRQQFWLYSIPAQSLWVVWYVLLEILKEYNRQVLYGGTGPSGVTTIILSLSAIPIGWMTLAVNLKRLHDRDKSYMWIILFSVPIIGTIWWLVELGFLKGTEGRNQYGEDPLSHTGTTSTYQKGSIQTEVNGNYKGISQEGSPTLGLKQEDKGNHRPQVDSKVSAPSNKHVGEYAFSGFVLTLVLIPAGLATLLVIVFITFIVIEP